MNFSRLLNKIINEHSIRSVDICEKLGLKKSIVSSFIDYYKTLMKCGLVKSKDETINDIKAALEKAVES